ncbi:MAG: hypothetical protein ACRCXZ_07525 [Patescibacteria group bacterium]
MKPKILVQITTFNPNQNLLYLINTLYKDTYQFLIIDNSVNENEVINSLSSMNSDSKIILQKHNNIGISKACQIGLDLFRSDDYNYFVTFDQDSRPFENYLNVVISKFNSLEIIDKEKIAALCPVYYFKSTNYLQTHSNNSNEYKFIRGGTSSGSIFTEAIKLESFNYDTELFIDYFDIDFYLKIKKSGLKVIEFGDVILDHELGDPKKVYLFGRSFNTLNYNPTRYYYRWRNKWRVYSRNLTNNIDWIYIDFRDQIKEVFKMLLFEDQKINKIKQIGNGTLDAILGKYGKKNF